MDHEPLWITCQCGGFAWSWSAHSAKGRNTQFMLKQIRLHLCFYCHKAPEIYTILLDPPNPNFHSVEPSQRVTCRKCFDQINPTPDRWCR
jgi:hypothetical protein